MNVVMNADNIDDPLEFLAYFGVGAFAGALSAGVGAGVNVALSGAGTFGAGFLGTNLGAAGIGFNIGFTSGFAGGFSGGFTNEFGNAILENKKLGEALNGAIGKGFLAGFSGGITAGILGGIDAMRNDRDFWTGSKIFERQYVTDGRAMSEINEFRNLSHGSDAYTVEIPGNQGPLNFEIEIPRGFKYDQINYIHYRNPGSGGGLFPFSSTLVKNGNNSSVHFSFSFGTPNFQNMNVGIVVSKFTKVQNQFAAFGGRYFHKIPLKGNDFWWNFITKLGL